MMKKILTLVMFVACFTSFAQSKIDGNWKASVESPNGTFELNYTFKVEDEKLTGAMKTQFGETPLENGKVDGKKISYSITFGEMTMENKGELVSDDEIVIKSERGDMKLARVK